ncbi:MAG: hypothetical protein V4603_10360 [Pseudomonadota bacterium]
MRIRLIGAAVLTALTLSACNQQEASAPPAETAQPAAAARANLSGIWQAMNTAHWDVEAHSAVAIDAAWQLGAIGAIPAGNSVLVGNGNIPYLPDAQAKRDANRAQWNLLDPEAKCYMLGIPRATYHNMPFQILQGDDADDLLMVYPFAAANRVINMKDFTPPPIDSWMGKSDGVWEGDTLVVTTTGQNEMSWLDRAGNHHSNQLKVTERFKLIDADHMSYEATMEDPLTYSAPWTITMTLYRNVEANAQLFEHKCVPFADKLLYSDLMGLEGGAGTPSQ